MSEGVVPYVLQPSPSPPQEAAVFEVAAAELVGQCGIESKCNTAVFTNNWGVCPGAGRYLIGRVSSEEIEEARGRFVIIGAQEAHAQRLGSHAPLGRILAIGPPDPHVAQDADRAKMYDLHELVWFDYRSALQITVQGVMLDVVPRTSVICKLIPDIRAVAGGDLRLQVLRKLSAEERESEPDPSRIIVLPTVG